MTFHILGMSSSQLTNSYFSEGLKPPTSLNSHQKQALYMLCIFNLGEMAIEFMWIYIYIVRDIKESYSFWSDN